jgi:hypothetical protein
VLARRPRCLYRLRQSFLRAFHAPWRQSTAFCDHLWRIHTSGLGQQAGASSGQAGGPSSNTADLGGTGTQGARGLPLSLAPCRGGVATNEKQGETKVTGVNFGHCSKVEFLSTRCLCAGGIGITSWYLSVPFAPPPGMCALMCSKWCAARATAWCTRFSCRGIIQWCWLVETKGVE